MAWLNYHHLLYFWRAAKLGGIAPAAAELRLAPQTVSSQIHELERALGEKLLTREGRSLVLTDVGRVALGYAEDIFATGQELVATLQGQAAGRRPLPLRVGVMDVLPKQIVLDLLDPALHLDRPVQLFCREDRDLSRFLAELAAHELDLVLADGPAGAGTQAISHLLGQCGTTFFAAPALAARARRDFPSSLERCPVLLPGAGATLRRSLDDWFHERGVRPQVAGEFDDPALMNAFGARGAGVFAGPSAISASIRQDFAVRVVGHAPALRQRFYGLSMERRMQHAGVVAVVGNRAR